MKNSVLLWVVALLLVFKVGSGHAQEAVRTVGVLLGQHEGYTLFTPQDTNNVYLIDDQGRLINEWTVDGAGRDAFLRENGNLVVSLPDPTIGSDNFAAIATFADDDGAFAEYTWDGELVWYYQFDRPNMRVHHGIEVMPNGNILFMAWQLISREEALAAGRDPEKLGDALWPDVIMEYSPTENAIVWEWQVWDHVIQDFDPTAPNYGDVAAAPHRIDLNFYQEYQWIEDWQHVNSLDYNPTLDQIAISAREFNEVWVIDHGVSSEAARGPAGDLLYRWGNPRAYRRGDESSRFISFQHDVQWVPYGYPGAGNIMVYSNRHQDGDTNYSRVVEFTPPLLDDGTYAIADGQAFGPTQPTWIYDGSPDNRFYSQYVSGADRLPNGNTLITPGQEGRIIEVSPDGRVVWEYVLPLHGQYRVQQGGTPDSSIFRVERYAADFAGLQGRILSPGPTLEALAGSMPDLAAHLSLDETLTNRLDETTPIRHYVFVGDYGQLVTLNVTSDAANGFTATLFAKDSATVSESSGPATLSFTDRRVLQSEPYRVEITTRDGSAADFTIVLINVEEPFAAIDVDIPRLLYGTILTDYIGADDTESSYAFWGAAGDVVTLEVIRISDDLLTTIELQTVDGEVLYTATADAETGTATIDLVTLPADSAYIVRVARAEGETTGQFEFILSQD